MSRRWQFIVTCAVVLPATWAQAEGDIRVADQGIFARLDSDRNGILTEGELPGSQTRLFARLVRLGDTDGDGGLTEQEWRTAIEPRRPAKPIEEKQRAELPGADEIRVLLLKLDVDANGVLTQQEAPKELKKTFQQIADQYDRNDDGQINTFELARGGPRLQGMAQRTVRQLDIDVERELKKFDREQGKQALRFSQAPRREEVLRNAKQSLALFEQVDTNQDGNLQRDEIPEQAANRWNRFFRLGDRDRNGELSQQEFLAAAQRAARFTQMVSQESDE